MGAGQQSQLASSQPSSPVETSASLTATPSHQTGTPAAAAPAVASEQSSGPTSEATNTSNNTKASSGPGQWTQGSDLSYLLLPTGSLNFKTRQLHLEQYS